MALFAKKLAEHLYVLAHRARAMADVPSVAEVALVRLDLRTAAHATEAVRRRLRLAVRTVPALALAFFPSKPSLAAHTVSLRPANKRTGPSACPFSSHPVPPKR